MIERERSKRNGLIHTPAPAIASAIAMLQSAPEKKTDINTGGLKIQLGPAPRPIKVRRFPPPSLPLPTRPPPSYTPSSPSPLSVPFSPTLSSPEASSSRMSSPTLSSPTLSSLRTSPPIVSSLTVSLCPKTMLQMEMSKDDAIAKDTSRKEPSPNVPWEKKASSDVLDDSLRKDSSLSDTPIGGSLPSASLFKLSLPTTFPSKVSSPRISSPKISSPRMSSPRSPPRVNVPSCPPPSYPLPPLPTPPLNIRPKLKSLDIAISVNRADVALDAIKIKAPATKASDDPHNHSSFFSNIDDYLSSVPVDSCSPDFDPLLASFRAPPATPPLNIRPKPKIAAVNDVIEMDAIRDATMAASVDLISGRRSNAFLCCDMDENLPTSSAESSTDKVSSNEMTTDAGEEMSFARFQSLYYSQSPFYSAIPLPSSANNASIDMRISERLSSKKGRLYVPVQFRAMPDVPRSPSDSVWCPKSDDPNNEDLKDLFSSLDSDFVLSSSASTDSCIV